MALGVHLGSCSCVCGTTLYRIDPADGSIVWQVTRQVGEHQLALDGASIFTLGADVEGKDDGRVMKRTDEGDIAPVDWHSAHGAETPITYTEAARHPTVGREAIAISADGQTIWALGGNGIASYELSTGQQQGIFIASRLTSQWSDAGAGSAMVVDPSPIGRQEVYVTAGFKIYKIDDQCNVIASVSTSFIDDMTLIGGNLAVAHEAGGFGEEEYLRLFSTNLIEVAAWPIETAEPQGYPLVGRNDTAFLNPAIPPPFEKYRFLNVQATNVLAVGSTLIVRAEQQVIAGTDYPGASPGNPLSVTWLAGMSADLATEDWWVKLDDPGGFSYGPPMATDGSSIFMIHDGKLERRDPAGGSVIWSVDHTLPTDFAVTDIGVGSDFVVVSGGGNDRSVVCFEKSDGSVRWATYHGGSVDVSVHVTGDDIVYAIGEVGTVSEVEL